MTDLRNCVLGNHEIIEIYGINKPYGCAEVVNWCEICGSVVVDLIVDGRVHPGRIKKMITPQVSKV